VIPGLVTHEHEQSEHEHSEPRGRSPRGKINAQPAAIEDDVILRGETRSHRRRLGSSKISRVIPPASAAIRARFQRPQRGGRDRAAAVANQTAVVAVLIATQTAPEQPAVERRLSGPGGPRHDRGLAIRSASQTTVF
jgi:hypothetical protein